MCFDGPTSMPFSRPSKEQLSALTPMERVAFTVGDLSSRHLGTASKAYNTVVMGAMLWGASCRRLRVHGLEHLLRYGKKDCVLVVANHRTFFDFFVITAVVYWKTRLSHRILFPVRSNFFYDHPLGPLVNGAMAGMTMFPPVLRTDDKQKRTVFNEYSVQRSIEELAVPGTTMGLHPEGTRNKGPDPYAMLRARPGVGKIALSSPHAHVIPAFVLGMGNQLPKEYVYNWLYADTHRVDAMFGPELDLSDLRREPVTKETSQLASERMVDAIGALAARHRAQFGPPPVTG